MSSAIAIDRPAPRPQPVARWRHTIVLVVMFLAMAAAGGMLQHRAVSAGSATLPHPSQPAWLYLGLIAMEWGLVTYVWKGGLRASGVSLRALIGGRWGTPRAVATDVLLALGVWAAWTAVEWTSDRVLGAGHAASVARLLPRDPLGVALWLVLSLSAGFAEELVFRGYFRAQFHALTGSATLALVLQALLFGVSHGYQGVRACASITLYGFLFGMLASSRKSLRPGMIAHAWTDIAAGIFRI